MPGSNQALLTRGCPLTPQEALLQALHSVKDGQLPLAGRQLWNTFLLPGRRAGTHLDLKASSYKKLSKLLQVRCTPAAWVITAQEWKHEGLLPGTTVVKVPCCSGLCLHVDTRRMHQMALSCAQ